MTPLQVKYAIDSIFTSGFTVGGSGIILPGNPTNPLGAVPKQYVDNSINGIKFPVSVTKIYDNQNFSMSKNYSSAESPSYAKAFYTFTQNDLMNYDIVIMQCKVLSFTIVGAPSSSENRYYVHFVSNTKDLINVRLNAVTTSYTLTPSGLVNNIFLTRSYDSYEANSFVDVDVSQAFHANDSVQIYFGKSNRDSADLAFTAAITILGIKFI